MNIGNFVRSGDPDTSQFAGQKALAYSPKIQRYVADLMDDGLPRIDEEIAEALNARGRPHTADAFRHGRKALSDRGLLIATGRTRPTKRGRELATEWIKPMHVVSVRAALEPHLTALAAWRAAEKSKRRMPPITAESTAMKCPVHPTGRKLDWSGCNECTMELHAARQTLGAVVTALDTYLRNGNAPIHAHTVLAIIQKAHTEAMIGVRKTFA